MATTDVNRTIEAVWRIESARVIARLARLVHDIGLAEDAAQERSSRHSSNGPTQGSRTTRGPG
jgi:predicted RNA polymerase sigma factor